MPTESSASRPATGHSIRTRRLLVPLTLGIALFGSLPVWATDYVQAPGSTLTFATRYQGEVFSGNFANFRTRASFDPQDLANARLDVLIAPGSASTANEDRDETLQGQDFFNSSKFAQARYQASEFRHLGGNEYAADGTLSLRGVSQPVTLTFTWTPGAQPVLAGKATVRRLDFAIGAGDWADLELIPNGVAVSTRVVLKPAPASATP
ncbi:MAG: YceI family protein [Pseudomonadota bacterium]|nr:YceI family protein [Pseudomonadota bacterium]